MFHFEILKYHNELFKIFTNCIEQIQVLRILLTLFHFTLKRHYY